MKKKNLGIQIVSRMMVPFAKKYLQKTRTVKLLGIVLDVPKGVFHPNMFFSTKDMCKFLSGVHLNEKKLMEVGCGSGAISIYSAMNGAHVFCCDINPLAVSTTQLNAKKNNVDIQVQLSNLFESMQENEFDYIINNPPYYPKDPMNMEENAWYAGKNHEYFRRFFLQSRAKLNKDGVIYMVLSSDCNLTEIKNIASECMYDSRMEATYQHLIEKTHILRFSIKDNL